MIRYSIDTMSPQGTDSTACPSMSDCRYVNAQSTGFRSQRGVYSSAATLHDESYRTGCMSDVHRRTRNEEEREYDVRRMGNKREGRRMGKKGKIIRKVSEGKTEERWK